MKKLPRAFYRRDTLTVARELLGCFLRSRRNGRVQIGRIIEVEAYLGAHDLACHSARGRTARTEPMFGPPGFAYVYMIYGMYHCFNVVTEPPGHAAAVLIRSVESVRGIDGRADGPGLLCRALGIDRSDNGHDLLSADLHLASDPRASPPRIRSTPRIGVDYAGDWARCPLRFIIDA